MNFKKVNDFYDSFFMIIPRRETQFKKGKRPRCITIS